MINVTATDILGSLFNPADVVCFRVFDDKKRGLFQGAKLQCECGKYKSVEETLKQHNAQDRGVFFVVNYGGQDDESITRINAQFLEMDDGTFEEQQAKIDAFPLKPSMIVRTQKSLHVYYFMDSTAKAGRFRTIQKQLVKQFGGDPMCVNESRVMRLPGFYHCKTDTRVMVECISFHPERKYTQDELSGLLPEVEEKPPENKSGEQKGLDIIMRGCVFLKHCKEDAASLSEHDWYAMISNLSPFEGGAKLIHEFSSPYPGYNASNTQKKINHFLESGTKPITCKTICEKGFKCPRFASGECKVKSPAALCYQPLSADALQEAVAGLPFKDSAIEDLQTAERFVRDYLYNQDVVIADVIINNVLRDHLKLKASFLKSLNAVYKDISRTYKASRAAKKSKAGAALPDWYEPMENNGLRFLPGVLAQDMAETQQVFYAAEQHFGYSGGVYSEMSEMEAQKLVQDRMLVRETKMTQIVDAEKQWRLKVQKDIRELNANPYIINVRNGLYNVLEDTLTEHTPDYYSTVQLAVTYDRKADCPLFRKYLEESMDGDMDQVGLIQEMLGYFLIPVNSAQKCFVIVGVAAAGKSVLLRVLNDVLLGRRNVSNVSWQALNERFKPAELFGKLANIFADLPTKNIDDNGMFKALTGEDYITAERKNKDPFSFRPYARLLFSCNEIPKNYGDRSDGFYRRLIIIRFDHSIPQEQRDPNLREKLAVERDGILTWALDGLRRLLDDFYVFSETEKTRAELTRYRVESNSVLSFVEECCELAPNAETVREEMFAKYKEYCHNAGVKPLSQSNFNKEIEAVPGEITRAKDKLGKRRTWRGIGMVS